MITVINSTRLHYINIIQVKISQYFEIWINLQNEPNRQREECSPSHSDQHKLHCYKSNCYKPKNYENIQSYSYWGEGMHGKQHNFLEIADRCFEQNCWKSNIHKEQRDF